MCEMPDLAVVHRPFPIRSVHHPARCHRMQLLVGGDLRFPLVTVDSPLRNGRAPERPFCPQGVIVN